MRKKIADNPSLDGRQVWVELSRRLALCFLCLLVIPLAFGLSVDNSRLARSRAVFLGLSIVFSYWTIYFSLVTWVLKTPLPLFRSHEIFTWLVIWVPNLLVLFVGLAIYYIRIKNKSFHEFFGRIAVIK